ncbi:MAG: CAP domain-containing protein [Pseudomonadota bacterium]
MRRVLIIVVTAGLFGCGGDIDPSMHGPDTAAAEDVDEGPEDGLPDLAGGVETTEPDGIVGLDTPPVDIPGCLTGVSCDDGDPCTEDSCDPHFGCVHGPVSEEHCSDGLPCTVDTCVLMEGCVFTPNHGACADGDPCTDDLCQPGLGCIHPWSELPCDDGDGCTWGDHCWAGFCRGTLNGTSACAYAQVPILGSCKKGGVTGSAKAETLATVNQVRALSGLPPVTYDSGGDGEVQAAALIMAVNGDLSHFPPQSWSCWTQAGYEGAGSSNLHMSWSTAPLDPKPPSEAVVGFLVDWNVPSLGHRRWLLDPFLPSVSWGAAGGYSAAAGDWPYVWAGILQVMKDAVPNLSGLDLDFVAYPVGDYPAEWFEPAWYLSFSALVDKGSSWGNDGVTYGQAQISVAGPGGPMSVYDVSSSSEYYGLPNHLQWKVAGLQSGVNYTVKISGVKDGGQTLSYEYGFRLE